MNLKQLHREYIDKANRPMKFGALPVEPQQAEVPIIAVERWHEEGGALTKQYQFRRDGDRIRFVTGLLEYEAEVQHHALIQVQADTVALRVWTHDVDRPTELDKEYARFADLLFRDVVYDPNHE